MPEAEINKTIMVNSSKKSVLVFTNSSDTHADIVIPKIIDLGGQVNRINTDELSKKIGLEIKLSGYSDYVNLVTGAGIIDFPNIYSAWIRRPFEFFFAPSKLKEKLTRQEIISSVLQVTSFLPPSIKIVDHPSKLYVSKQKLLQLKKAKEIGFIIPRTLVTNNPKTAQNFYKTHKNVIIKSVSDGITRQGYKAMSTFTTRVNSNMDFSLVRNCPTLFQEEIKKKSELRITIIGRKIFAVEIDSQKYSKSRLDWRKGVLDFKKIPHKPVKLPKKLEVMMLQLLDSYGLNFGAIDMAVTPQNDYVFFELNPAGQFLWLEDLTGLPLAEEMAKFLLGIS